MAPLRCVIFDLDDTLVPTSALDKAAVEAAASSIGGMIPGGPDEAAVRFRALLKAGPFPPDDSTSLAQWREGLWRSALLTTDASKGTQAHVHWVMGRLENFQFSPDVHGMLDRLNRTYVLGLITNGHVDAQRPKLVACGAERIFGRRVVISGEQPEPKPHPSIFQTALDLAGTTAVETVMVGDSLAADIDGANAAGFKASVWVRPRGAESSERPTHTIDDILDLERVLDEIAKAP